ncbi:putative entry exclusion protein TrbK-alt [Porphyrobacter sp. YT40]|uniref:putative entry exclusion protein TrbK-alt n=1 Tax=Porphyrobacter sp. YT40 TaxID=2547601 RepID=UPI0011445E1B|nr:putative entry exclusion protein TrbK-alt [Porphyrobacter sp. YT40]QDH33838.1 hypothetical protein E2E27_05510 [Porphyrobacter sp. YT40]
MDGKLLARIGAAVFVGLAVTMTLVQLLEGPAPRSDPSRAVQPRDGDPLALQLRACAAMGERALSSPDCRAAWAEKRRRFFGVNRGEASSELGEAPDAASVGAPLAVDPET